MISTLPMLSIMIWMPIAAAVLILFGGADRNATRGWWIALSTSLICLGLCIPLYMGFDLSTADMQYVESINWIPDFNIHYQLGVDGLSLALIALTCFTSLIVILAAKQQVSTKLNQYLAAFLVMHGMLVGVFAAMDSILFYFFWEGSLIPIYLSIGVWGSANRNYASIKFFLYTFFGSALMLVGLLYMGHQANSFAIQDFYKLPLNSLEQTLIFVAFLLAFAVKIPMWPVHTWLPHAHTEAPTGGSVVLAALMLKMGGYGFLRFSLPITPDACLNLHWLMIILSLIAVVYIGLVAIAQTDMKRLIAYSSVAHMGFATLGTFIIYDLVAHTGNHQVAQMSLEGAIFQMISHAFSSGAMFVGIGILYSRMHTRLIKDFGGIVNTMPLFAALFLVVAMANTGLPGTSGFVGEFMIILSSWQASFWIAILAASTLILSAAYTLWMYKRVFFGEITNNTVAQLHDIVGSERFAFILLVVVLIGLGVYPKPLIDTLHASVSHLIDLSVMTKLT